MGAFPVCPRHSVWRPYYTTPRRPFPWWVLTSQRLLFAGTQILFLQTQLIQDFGYIGTSIGAVHDL